MAFVFLIVLFFIWPLLWPCGGRWGGGYLINLISIVYCPFFIRPVWWKKIKKGDKFEREWGVKPMHVWHLIFDSEKLELAEMRAVASQLLTSLSHTLDGGNTFNFKMCTCCFGLPTIVWSPCFGLSSPACPVRQNSDPQSSTIVGLSLGPSSTAPVPPVSAGTSSGPLSNDTSDFALILAKYLSAITWS